MNSVFENFLLGQASPQTDRDAVASRVTGIGKQKLSTPHGLLERTWKNISDTARYHPR
jgi:hypothetical protein